MAEWEKTLIFMENRDTDFKMIDVSFTSARDASFSLSLPLFSWFRRFWWEQVKYKMCQVSQVNGNNFQIQFTRIHTMFLIDQACLARITEHFIRHNWLQVNYPCPICLLTRQLSTVTRQVHKLFLCHSSLCLSSFIYDLLVPAISGGVSRSLSLSPSVSVYLSLSISLHFVVGQLEDTTRPCECFRVLTWAVRWKNMRHLTCVLISGKQRDQGRRESSTQSCVLSLSGYFACLQEVTNTVFLLVDRKNQQQQQPEKK